MSENPSPLSDKPPGRWFLYFFRRVKDKIKLEQAFTVDPVYLRHGYSQVVDFMVRCTQHTQTQTVVAENST